jgi:hypothetical protein
MSSVIIQKFEGASITEEMLSDAAKLFSLNYGVWGPSAAEKMGKFAKQGTKRFAFPLSFFAKCYLPVWYNANGRITRC